MTAKPKKKITATKLLAWLKSKGHDKVVVSGLSPEELREHLFELHGVKTK